MKNHAFLIEAHAYPEITAAVINRLSADNHYFFIHIDKKTKDIAQFAKLRSNHVFFTPKRYCVRWGSYEQILLTLTLIKEAQNSGIDFDYYHLISGQDYPVYKARVFDEFFDEKDESYMELIKHKDFSKRYMYYHLNSLMNVHGRIGRLLDKLFVSFQKKVSVFVKGRRSLGIMVYKGSNWWSLNKSVVNYIIDYLNTYPDYTIRFKHTYCCDEIFFHTIVFNSLYKGSVKTNSLRYVDWNKKAPTDSTPRVLDEDDYQIIRTSGCLFARKVSLEKSKELIRKLG